MDIINLKYIEDLVLEEMEVSNEQFVMRDRTRKYVYARHLFNRLVGDFLTKHSLASIGQHIGGRDHATVLHSRKEANNLIDTNDDFRTSYKKLHGQIKKVHNEIKRNHASRHDAIMEVKAMEAKIYNWYRYAKLKDEVKDEIILQLASTLIEKVSENICSKVEETFKY